MKLHSVIDHHPAQAHQDLHAAPAEAQVADRVREVGERASNRLIERM